MQTKIRDRAGILFSALGNTTRLRIVELLVQAPLSVNDIAHGLNIGQSGTSQHLAILTRAGVLVVRRYGTSRLYAIRGPRIGAILQLIEEFCTAHQLEGDNDIVDGSSEAMDRAKI